MPPVTSSLTFPLSSPHLVLLPSSLSLPSYQAFSPPIITHPTNPYLTPPP
ncbi:hypothetical protein AMTRI_Chr09g42020 [Amborella trichopoda]